MKTTATALAGALLGLSAMHAASETTGGDAPYTVKQFKDKGRLTVKQQITKEGIEETIKTTASSLDKQKGGSRLEVANDAMDGDTAFDLMVTVVPEPSTRWLTLAGVAVALGATLGSRRPQPGVTYL